jgi:hypothetical protein
MCDKELKDVCNIGLYNCSYSIDGKTESGEIMKKDNLREPSDKLLTFEDSTDHRTNW